jgi:hypothetical protein
VMTGQEGKARKAKTGSVLRCQGKHSMSRRVPSL